MLFDGFQGFLRRLLDLMDSYGSQGSEVKRPVPAFANGVLPLKKPLLDTSWPLFDDSRDFQGVH